MHDEEGRDTKVLCVPAKDDRKENTKDLEDIDPPLLDEISHFFDVYKDLEPGKDTRIEGWASRAIAEQAVTEARQRRETDPIQEGTTS